MANNTNIANAISSSTIPIPKLRCSVPIARALCLSARSGGRLSAESATAEETAKMACRSGGLRSVRGKMCGRKDGKRSPYRSFCCIAGDRKKCR